MTSFTPDQWIILGLVFVLGLLVGMWMTSGGRRKWKTRYNEEIDKRRALEKTHQEREAHWASRETELRHQDSLRAAAARDRGPVDRDGDGYADRRPGDVDGDGVPNRSDPHPADRRR
jgi:hypothetical protein